MFKKLLAGATLTLMASASALAAPLSFTYDAPNDLYTADLVGVAGTNEFTFSFPFDATLSGSVDTATLTTYSKKTKVYVTTGTALSSVTLDGQALSFDTQVLSTATPTTTGKTSYSWTLLDAPLTAGVPHVLSIKSTGAFMGNLVVTPAVPEAGSVALAAAGIAVVGLLARRRKAS